MAAPAIMLGLLDRKCRSEYGDPIESWPRHIPPTCQVYHLVRKLRTNYGEVCLPVGRHLSGAVTAVNDDIGASGISASITSQVHICTFQLFGLTITAHGDHALP